jgi:mono/diheme cytochrome c family protein
MIRQFRKPYVVVLALLLPVLFRLVTRGSPMPQSVDLAAAAKGRELFEHAWTAGDPRASNGDGLGPVFNANSCVACHRQGGAGGSGSLENNVTTFTIRAVEPGQTPRQGVVHAQATSAVFQESLTDVHPLLPTALPFPLSVRPEAASSMAGCDIARLQFPPGVHVSQRKTPALFGAKLIDDLPDSVIISQERLQRFKSGGARAADRAGARRPFRLEGSNRFGAALRAGCLRQ